MNEQQVQPTRTSVARRGVLAGVAALVAGVLGKSREEVAQAANGDPLVIGANNFESRGAFLSNSGTDPALQVAIGTTVTYLNGTSVLGTTNAAGGYGVHGNNVVDGAYGVRGDSRNLIGVLGAVSPSAGFLAAPAQSAGVYGLSNGSAAGVVGQSNSGVGAQGSSNGNVGVLGTSTASHGVFGSSTNGYGVYATSTNSSGVVASTNAGNAIQGASNGNVGVLGTSQSSIGGFFSSASSTGLYATGPAGGFAARFDGPVLVNGNFTAIGGSKSAAVPHPDGSHRRLYCVEAPESWFEDFGEGQLQNGRGQVRLDADFAALVRGDKYHVFLTEYEDQGGLFVTNVNARGFDVRARTVGASGTFSYRVVAKRKDIAGPRLERVDIPPAPQRPPAPVAPPAITPLAPPRLDSNAQTVDGNLR
jgi:hypothetical protein